MLSELLDPEIHDEEVAANISYASRQPLAPGARLTLIDNGKPKAKEILVYVGEGLKERLQLGSVEVFSKGQASRVIDADEARSIADSSDVVLAGLGDCGACSACSLADAIIIEELGVPSTVLITDVFIRNVAEFSATIGLPNYHSAVVPHPVSSKTDVQIRAYAATVVDLIARQLTEQPLVADIGQHADSVLL
jgi:hypothetical protein